MKEKGRGSTLVCSVCDIVIAPQQAKMILGEGKVIIHLQCEKRIIYNARQGIFELLSSLPKKACLWFWTDETKKKLLSIHTLKELEETVWKIGDDLLTFINFQLACIKMALANLMERLGILLERLFFWKPAWAL